jgi:hypothetical protein
MSVDGLTRLRQTPTGLHRLFDFHTQFVSRTINNNDRNNDNNDKNGHFSRLKVFIVVHTKKRKKVIPQFADDGALRLGPSKPHVSGPVTKLYRGLTARLGKLRAQPQPEARSGHGRSLLTSWGERIPAVTDGGSPGPVS